MHKRLTLSKILWVLMIIILPTLVMGEWQLQTNGLPQNTGEVFALDACDGLNAVFADAIVDFNTPLLIYKTSNGGQSWNSFTISEIDTSRTVLDISMVDPDHIWVAVYDPPSIYATTDGGINWELQFSDSSNVWINYLEMFDTQNGVAMLDGDYSLGEPANFLTTNNGGLTWESHQQAGMPGSSYHLWHPIDFISPTVGYFYKHLGSESQIWKTVDGCNTWQLAATIPSPVDFPVLRFYDENIGVLVGSSTVWTTLDGGTSWSMISDKEEAWVGDVEFVPGDPNKIWVSNSQDLLFSDDGGAHWETILTDASEEFSDMAIVDSANAWVMGLMGVYHTTNIALVTIDPKIIEPYEFAITNIFPTPFNPSTNIQYELSAGADVTIAIFNLMGRIVWMRTNESKSAGMYNIRWDGLNNNGELATSGIYLISLSTPEFRIVQKAVLVR